jgi:hypothetical protein
MNPIVMVFIGFGAGIFTMTIVSVYKYILQFWNGGVG